MFSSHNYVFPLNLVFDSRNWFYDWRDYWKARNRDVSDLDREFVRGIVESIERYKMPIIRLDKSNSREAICLVFEKVNAGGNIDRGAKGKEIPKVSCNRDSLLDLPLVAYKKHASAVEDGFIEAGNFLNELKIIWHKDIPYPPIVMGLAATFAILGRDAQTAAAKQKLARWFWNVTLGELYGSSTESRLARDVSEMVEWIAGNDEPPRCLDEAWFQTDRLRTLRTRVSAAYKGLASLVSDAMGKPVVDEHGTNEKETEVEDNGIELEEEAYEAAV